MKNTDYLLTLLLHGTNDKVIPYEQSVLLMENLLKDGVESELITITECKYQFDKDWQSPVVQNALEEVITFLTNNLK